MDDSKFKAGNTHVRNEHMSTGNLHLSDMNMLTDYFRVMFFKRYFIPGGNFSW